MRPENFWMKLPITSETSKKNQCDSEEEDAYHACMIPYLSVGGYGVWNRDPVTYQTATHRKSLSKTNKVESRGHGFGCDGPGKKWVVILPRSRQILIHAYKKMLALPKVSRAGGGVVFHHVCRFLAAYSNACSLLIFW